MPAQTTLSRDQARRAPDRQGLPGAPPMLPLPNPLSQQVSQRSQPPYTNLLPPLSSMVVNPGSLPSPQNEGPPWYQSAVLCPPAGIRDQWHGCPRGRPAHFSADSRAGNQPQTQPIQAHVTTTEHPPFLSNDSGTSHKGNRTGQLEQSRSPSRVPAAILDARSSAVPATLNPTVTPASLALQPYDEPMYRKIRTIMQEEIANESKRYEQGLRREIEELKQGNKQAMKEMEHEHKKVIEGQKQMHEQEMEELKQEYERAMKGIEQSVAAGGGGPSELRCDRPGCERTFKSASLFRYTHRFHSFLPLHRFVAHPET